MNHLQPKRPHRPSSHLPDKYPAHVYQAWCSISDWEQSQWCLAALRQEKHQHSFHLFAHHYIKDDPNDFLRFCNSVSLRLELPFQDGP